LLSESARMLGPAPADHVTCADFIGGRTRARTWDPLIKSQLLYQLSYAPDTNKGWIGGLSRTLGDKCQA
jgi:hypothetical protein